MTTANILATKALSVAAVNSSVVRIPRMASGTNAPTTSAPANWNRRRVSSDGCSGGAVVRAIARAPRRASASDPEVTKPGAFRFGPFIDVAQVDQRITVHHAGDRGEIERPELVPFGDDDQGVGAARGAFRVVGERNAADQLLGLFARDRVEGRNIGATLGEPGDERKRRRIALVVGVGLEGEAE